jgi:hypothetical protein
MTYSDMTSRLFFFLFKVRRYPQSGEEGLRTGRGVYQSLFDQYIVMTMIVCSNHS